MYVIYSGMEERLCRMPESKLLNQIKSNQSNQSRIVIINIEGRSTLGWSGERMSVYK